MPSPSGARARWLRRKEFRELGLSPAFAILLVLASLLVGHEFIASMRTYAEMSGTPGRNSALALGMNPLDGILVPTFGAYDLVATLLLPFVVIRIFSNERATGAWTLLVQSPASVREMVRVKVAALGAAWLIALVPGLIAVALWVGYGGHVYAPELAALLAGHILRASLTVSLAAAAAAVTPQAATAAIVTLGVTIGSWALDFEAATRGGMWARVSAFTPTSALRQFEQGLVRASTVGVLLVATAAGLAIAIIWLRPGETTRRNIMRTVRAVAFLVIGAAIVSRVHASLDVTEDRRHSFSEPDEARLRALPSPLKIEIHLGAEDPRLTDLKREILDRLERVVPGLEVSYLGAGGTGLLASPDSLYGQIWYEMGGKRVMLKSAIEPLVLGTIYDLAGNGAVPTADSESYRGYPLSAAPIGSNWVFFLIIPAIVLTGFWRYWRA